jgi:hypothetical protein
MRVDPDVFATALAHTPLTLDDVLAEIVAADQ